MAPRLVCMEPRPWPTPVCAAARRMLGPCLSRWGPSGSRAISDAFAPPRFAGAFTLRQRMLNFVQNIQCYMMFEVLEPTWHVLEKNLKSVSFNRMCHPGRVSEGTWGPGDRV